MTDSIASLLRIASRNVLLNWRHSLAALLSIGFGFVSLSLFQGYMADINRLYQDTFFRRQMLGNILIEKAGAESAADIAQSLISAHDQAVLDRFLSSESKGIQNRVRFLNISGMVQNGISSTLFSGYGYDIEAGAKMRRPNWEWNTVAGRPLSVSDPQSVVMGKGLASILDCRTETQELFLTGAGGYLPEARPFICRSPRLQLNTTTITGQINAMDIALSGIVDGVFKEVDSNLVMMPLPLAQKLLNTEGVSLYSIELIDSVNPGDFISRLKSFLAQNGAQLAASLWQEHRYGDLFVRTMQLLSIFRNFVVAVIIMIAGLSVLNTLVKIVKERTRETGTLRSLGFLPRDIILIFLFESVLLSLLGSFFGLVTTLFLTAVTNAAGIIYKAGMLSDPILFRIAYVPSIYFQTSLFLGAVAMVAALVPAVESSRMKIPEALGHV